jgi:hypothetical protein
VGGHGFVPGPEPEQPFRVGEVGGEPGAELFVVEQRRDEGEGGAGVAHEGQAGHAQGVVDAGSPVALEDLGEDRHDVVHGQVVVVAGERVEPDAAVVLVGVEDHHPALLGQGGGDAVDDVGDEVALPASARCCNW